MGDKGAQSAGASGSSLASTGFKVYGDITSAQGKAAGARYRATTLLEAAQRARVSAAQTGASESEQLTQTLGNIDAHRAAAHGDPTSPMAAAYRDSQEDLGLTKKTIDVDNIQQQARQDESDAAYLQSTAKYALLGGYVSAGSDIASSLAKAIAPVPGV
jgi:hypothetical protein